MEHPVVYYLNGFLDMLGVVYLIIIPLALGSLFVRRSRKETVNILSAVNLTQGMTAFYLLVLFILAISDYGRPSQYDQYGAGQFQRIRLYILFMQTAITLTFLFSKAARKSWFLSFMLLFLTHWYEVLLWVLKFFRNYTPSSWYISQDLSAGERIILLVLIIMLMIISYIHLAQYHKLPHPSSIYKSKGRRYVQ